MSSITSPTDLFLEETEQRLAMNPEFLAKKGLDSNLRMNARNGSKLSFPLEVNQHDRATYRQVKTCCTIVG